MVLARNLIDRQTFEANTGHTHRGPDYRPKVQPIYTISDLASAFNVTLRALRFYEKRGLLQPRREGRERIYMAGDLERLKLILKGKRLGFTLAEIQAMIGKKPAARPANGRLEAGRPDAALPLKPAQVLAQIDHLERQRFDIDRAISELRAVHEGLAGA